MNLEKIIVITRVCHEHLKLDVCMFLSPCKVLNMHMNLLGVKVRVWSRSEVTNKTQSLREESEIRKDNLDMHINTIVDKISWKQKSQVCLQQTIMDLQYSIIW